MKMAYLANKDFTETATDGHKSQLSDLGYGCQNNANSKGLH